MKSKYWRFEWYWHPLMWQLGPFRTKWYVEWAFGPLRILHLYDLPRDWKN